MADKSMFSRVTARHQQKPSAPSPTAEEPPSPAPAPKRSSRKLAKRNDPNYRQVGLYLPRDIHQAARIKAMEEGREISQVVEDLLSEWLNS
jgi:hypothetical protein